MAEDDRNLLIEVWRKLLVESDQPRRLEDLDSKDGISPQEVLAVLKKMAISPKTFALPNVTRINATGTSQSASQTLATRRVRAKLGRA